MNYPRTKCPGKLTTARLDVYWCAECKNGKGQAWLLKELSYKSFKEAEKTHR